MSTFESRNAEVKLLMAKAQDETDPYDSHHGTDRSPESLEWAHVNDPETYERVTAKMARGE